MTEESEGTAEKADWYMGRLVNDGIKPYVEEIAAILSRGEVPVVAFEPTGRSVPALDGLGWNQRAVFGVPRSVLGTALAQDEVTRQWLARQRGQGEFPILVISHLGSTLLVNYGGSGFSIEPGSLNSVLP
ncbi:MAG: hypothetical protein HY898_08890 [Deltaproteobacteria bacterium]|nr:hypothetical protein [Deltaproteobacteria bacterium]